MQVEIPSLVATWFAFLLSVVLVPLSLAFGERTFGLVKCLRTAVRSRPFVWGFLTWIAVAFAFLVVFTIAWEKAADAAYRWLAVGKGATLLSVACAQVCFRWPDTE